MPKDIIVFPKIANSYAIRKNRDSSLPSNEWEIFGWSGYRIGNYYESYDGRGTLYLSSGDALCSYFESSERHVMDNIKTAVAYSWLKAEQRLINNDNKRASKGLKPLADDKWFSKRGLISEKYGVRAFAGGPNLNSIFSIFDYDDKLLGCVDQRDYDIVGRIVVVSGYDNVIYKRRNEGNEGILRRLMRILRND